ncbi:hypothetical protein DFJ73DRAFT_833698 [Zopfochytrium polystomum]|nr:hypothetical protein DFJ73DRAFT_833698 [Zopfochytrium polystomum]
MHSGDGTPSSSTASDWTQTTSTSEPPQLAHFAVYNPSWGPTEDSTADQICFFSPTNTPTNDQLRLVGLAQALVNFSRSFLQSSVASDVVHSSKYRMVMHEPEPGFWMQIRVRLGTMSYVGKDGKRVVEYVPSSVHDTALKRVLERAYDRFKLFNRGFQKTVDESTREELKEKLDSFYTNYLDRLNLINMDILEMTAGVHYLPMDRSLFLEVASTMNELERSFPIVAASILLWRHYIIWSGLGSVHTFRVLYDYVTDAETGKMDDSIVNQVKPKGEAIVSTRQKNLQSIPTTSTKETLAAYPSTPPTGLAGPPTASSILYPFSALTMGQTPTNGASSLFPIAVPQSPSRRAGSSQSGASRFSGFIVGPEVGPDGGWEPDAGRAGEPERPDDWSKRVYLGAEGAEHRMVIYQLMDETTLIFLLPASFGTAASVKDGDGFSSSTFCTNLQSYIHARIPGVARLLAEAWVKSRKSTENAPGVSYRFFYFQAATLAIRTNIALSKATMLSQELVTAIGALHEDLINPAIRLTEVYTRTVGDIWMVGRRAAGRLLLMLFPKSDLGVVDVADEANKILSRDAWRAT